MMTRDQFGAFAMHRLEEWQSRAGDPRLPHWLRVAAAAYGQLAANGHATFRAGDLAIILGSPGRPYRNVGRAIDEAITYGWLAKGSFHRCLVVPDWAVHQGPWADPRPCTIHQARQ